MIKAQSCRAWNGRISGERNQQEAVGAMEELARDGWYKWKDARREREEETAAALMVAKSKAAPTKRTSSQMSQGGEGGMKGSVQQEEQPRGQSPQQRKRQWNWMEDECKFQGETMTASKWWSMEIKDPKALRTTQDLPKLMLPVDAGSRKNYIFTDGSVWRKKNDEGGRGQESGGYAAVADDQRPVGGQAKGGILLMELLAMKAAIGLIPEIMKERSSRIYEIWTDNAQVASLLRGESSAAGGADEKKVVAVILRQLQSVRDRDLTINIFWMEAHQKEGMKEKGGKETVEEARVRQGLVAGNALADVAAKLFSGAIGCFNADLDAILKQSSPFDLLLQEAKVHKETTEKEVRLMRAMMTKSEKYKARRIAQKEKAKAKREALEGGSASGAVRAEGSKGDGSGGTPGGTSGGSSCSGVSGGKIIGGGSSSRSTSGNCVKEDEKVKVTSGDSKNQKGKKVKREAIADEEVSSESSAEVHKCGVIEVSLSESE